jgi:hypothetical protein
MLGVFFDGNSFILYVGTSLRFLFYVMYVVRTYISNSSCTVRRM